MSSTKVIIDSESKPDVVVSQTRPQTDGGKFAWLQVCGCFFLMFNTWGLVNSYGVYQTYYETDLFNGTSASDISWIGSIQTFLLVFGALSVGPMIDRGHMKPFLLVGSFLIVLGMMMTSLCREYWQAVLAQGVVVGLGFACLFVISVSIIPQYFRRRRALAIGVFNTGGPLGAIIYTAVFQQLQPKIGFGWATRTIAFIGLVTLLVPILALRWKMPARKPPSPFDPMVWKDTSFLLASCASFFGFLGLYIPFFYIQVYSLEQHVSTERVGAYSVILLNVGSLLGRLVPSYLADHYGSLNSISVCTLCTAILGFAWISVTSTAGLVIFCLFFGFFTGAYIALCMAVVATLTPDLRIMGLRVGLFLLPASIGVLIGNPIAGALLDRGWTALQAFCGAAMVASWGLLTATRLNKTGARVLVVA